MQRLLNAFTRMGMRMEEAHRLMPQSVAFVLRDATEDVADRSAKNRLLLKEVGRFNAAQARAPGRGKWTEVRGTKAYPGVQQDRPGGFVLIFANHDGRPSSDELIERIALQLKRH